MGSFTDALDKDLFTKVGEVWYVNFVLAVVLVLVVLLVWYGWQRWVAKGEGMSDYLATVNSGGRMNLRGVDQGQVYFGFTGQPVGPEFNSVGDQVLLNSQLQEAAKAQETNEQFKPEEGFAGTAKHLKEGNLEAAMKGL